MYFFYRIWNEKRNRLIAFLGAISVICFSSFFAPVFAQTSPASQTPVPPSPWVAPSQFSQSSGVGALAAFGADSISQTTARISGKVAHNTPPFIVFVDTTLTGTFSDSFSPDIQSDGTFSYELTGLKPSYMYHYVAVRSSDFRTRLSSINSFVTLPVISRLYISKVDSSSVTIAGPISEGANNPLIIYGTKPNELTGVARMGLSDGIYTTGIAGLKENTTYYYQLVGDSYWDPSVKVYYAPVMSFETLRTTTPAPPIPVLSGLDGGASATFAAGSTPVYNLGALVQCGTGGPLTSGGRQSCGFPEFMELINRVINFLLFLVVPIIATCIILYAGLLILFSGGSTENVSKARGMITKAVVGMVIAMGAWLLVKSILVALGVDTTVFPVFY